ncbi:alpha/beta fold hydrolase [Bacillus mangrovi]|uniref:Alpha/beta fold hydrolase n=1 Tax=Metabacillus mangrovi TaxID=1491830 RepID=A0A7X2S7J2_9BACI|nr:alpha/beta hydrolase [Metabacillus mangrovi]MTH54935.1 alpha/beta fold hydrolase [Metabacillus mangrovi]
MPTIQVQDIQLHYEVRGDGPPVVFLHGLGAGWRMWEPQIEAFSSKYRMIMPDMRGHGESSKHFPDNKFSARVMADDLKALLDRMGLQKVHLVGLSYGSVTAQLFAAKYPQYVDKLVLSNGYSEIPTKVAGWVLKLSNAIFKMLSYNTIINQMLKIYGKDEYTKKVLRDSFTFDKDMLIFAKNSEFPEHTSELKNITAATLVLGGEKKVMGVDEKKGSQTLFDHIPDAVLALFKDAFDPLSTMKKDQFNEMLLDFLAGTDFKEYDGVTVYRKER